MASSRTDVLETYGRLPPEAKREVEDFVSFLSLRYAGNRGLSASRRSKLSTGRFIGMWRDRSELRDSTAWVRRARRAEWR